MNRETYRAAFDSIRFRDDFQAETAAKLRAACGQPNKKESFMMTRNHTKRILVLAAAVIALLAVSAAAVALFLTPKQVAEQAGDSALAAAFSEDGAVLLDERVETGDVTVTLSGIVSGKGLSAFSQELDEARTYVVVSMANTDGMPIEEAAFTHTLTPLVSGYEPRFVNSWTLGAGCVSFVHEGIQYFLYDCKNLELFADHTVYLALYEGNDVPGPETFSMAEDGSISFTDKLDGARALFTLPLDPAGADPDAARQLLVDAGFGDFIN